jgi:hypothetical protein
VAASVPEVRAHAWYLTARVAEELGDEATATRGLGWARRLDPTRPDLLRLLADHAVRRNDIEGQLQLCLDALELPAASPCDHAWAHRGAAAAWLALGHSGDARRHLDALVDDGCPSPAGEVAWAHATGDRDAARRQLVAWSPRRPQERLDAARWALDLDRADLALQWLAPLAGHPEWPEASTLLARVAEVHAEPVRTLLAAVAPDAGPPWSDLLDDLGSPE